MKRKEYKVNINVLGSNNGQKVRRGVKPGLLVEESNNLYLFTHNRALNNCNYLGNRKGFLSVWKFDESYIGMSPDDINVLAKTGCFGGVLFTISYETTETTTATTTTATAATETTTTTTTQTTETTNNANNMETNNANSTNNVNNATSQNINVEAGGVFSAMGNGSAYLSGQNSK